MESSQEKKKKIVLAPVTDLSRRCKLLLFFCFVMCVFTQKDHKIRVLGVWLFLAPRARERRQKKGISSTLVFALRILRGLRGAATHLWLGELLSPEHHGLPSSCGGRELAASLYVLVALAVRGRK